MRHSYQITSSQKALLAKYEAAANDANAKKAVVIEAILAGHGVTTGTLVAFENDCLVVDDGKPEAE